jgi:dTDP-4-dehydrorhamnose reductase
MIWLIGNKGMLGKELSNILLANDIKFFGTDREVDIRDSAALHDYSAGKSITWIINCSAYTSVDKAEEEEDIARSINALGAGYIAQVAYEIGATMIHISTDYVFKGDGNRPYLESDPVDPQGAYGKTKAEGETLVASLCPRHFIVRTAWLYGKYGLNYVATMLKLMKEKTSISVVNDQHGTPTWAYDLAMAIFRMVTINSNQYGVYHFTDAGETTWFEFAAEIQCLGREMGLLCQDCKILPIATSQYPSKVQRPKWSVLSKEKITTCFGITPPDWKKSLKIYLQELKKMGLY